MTVGYTTAKYAGGSAVEVGLLLVSMVPDFPSSTTVEDYSTPEAVTVSSELHRNTLNRGLGFGLGLGIPLIIIIVIVCIVMYIVSKKCKSTVDHLLKAVGVNPNCVAKNSRKKYQIVRHKTARQGKTAKVNIDMSDGSPPEPHRPEFKERLERLQTAREEFRN